MPFIEIEPDDDLRPDEIEAMVADFERDEDERIAQGRSIARAAVERYLEDLPRDEVEALLTRSARLVDDICRAHDIHHYDEDNGPITGAAQVHDALAAWAIASGYWCE